MALWNWTTIGSDNGLSPSRYLNRCWPLIVGPMEKTCAEAWIKVLNFFLKIIHLNISPEKYLPVSFRHQRVPRFPLHVSPSYYGLCIIQSGFLITDLWYEWGYMFNITGTSWYSNKLQMKYLSLWARPGPRLNIKTVLSRYRDFHVKDKTAVRTSYL